MKTQWTGTAPATTKPVTPELLAMMVELLPTIGSLRDLCAITGLRLDTVRREVAPFLAIMKLQGTHPQCGCGRDRFHPYGCVDSQAKSRPSGCLPGHRREKTDELLRMRANAIEMLVAGERFVDIDRALGLAHGCARKYLRFLTAEQAAERARALEGKALARGDLASRRPEIERLLRDGLSMSEIARRFGVGPATVQYHAKPIAERLRAEGLRCGCGKPLSHPGVCDHNGTVKAEQVEFRKRVVSLLAQGMQTEAVAKAVGRGTTSVGRYMRHLTPDQAALRRLRRRRAGNLGDFVAIKPTRDATYARLSAKVPRGMPDHLRDDVLSEMYLAVMEGEAVESVAGRASHFISRCYREWASRFGPVSLNESLFEDGEDLIHSIPDPAAIAAFQRLDNVRMGARR